MSLLKNEKGYYIKDENGTIHAKNIPNKGLASKLLKGIELSIKEMRYI